MQQAIPYKSWLPLYANTTNPPSFISSSSAASSSEKVLKGGLRNISNMVQDNAVIVFAKRGCCMSHVVKRLLLGLSVNPPIFEIDEEDEIGVLRELEDMIVGDDDDDDKKKKVQLPAVFIGGKLFGGLDRLMASHISGDLVPLLKDAGALWL